MGYRNIKKQKKLISFLQIEDFDFSMSRDNAYYQFYKNAPVASIATVNAKGILIKIGQISQRCQIGQDKKGYFIIRRLRKLDNQSDRHVFWSG